MKIPVNRYENPSDPLLRRWNIWPGKTSFNHFLRFKHYLCEDLTGTLYFSWKINSTIDRNLILEQSQFLNILIFTLFWNNLHDQYKWVFSSTRTICFIQGKTWVLLTSTVHCVFSVKATTAPTPITSIQFLNFAFKIKPVDLLILCLNLLLCNTITPTGWLILMFHK